MQAILTSRICSLEGSNSQIKLFSRRIKRAEKELLALTPQPKRGCRQYSESEPLQIKVDELLKRYQVADYFQWFGQFLIRRA